MSFLGRLLRSRHMYPLFFKGTTRYPSGKVKMCHVQFSMSALKYGQPLSVKTASDHVSLSPSADICVGCGSLFQTVDSDKIGYVLPKVFNGYTKKMSLKTTKTSDENSESSTEMSDENSESSTETSDENSEPSLICLRCFNLKHYNTALNITSNIDTYKEHLISLKEKRALVVLIIDAVDFPGSLFPDLDNILGHRNRVHVVVNKVDLLPNLNRKTLLRLEEYIRSEYAVGTRSHDIQKVWFVSSKTGKGIDSLCKEIAYSWGNRGDVYLLGCTNVGKSSLFNHLITNLCAAIPGDRDTVSGVLAPSPVISHWPGTTLGLISFPILSVGKRRRLLEQVEKASPDMVDKTSSNKGLQIRELHKAKKPSINPGIYECLPDIEEILDEIGIRKPQTKTVVPKQDIKTEEAIPKNKIWLRDTPGAINDDQLINHLSTKELNILLPKKSLVPRSYILKQGYSLFIGGVARLDYVEGNDSAYFTVFCASTMPIHASQTLNADQVYEKNLGKPLLMVPFGDEERLARFPPLDYKTYNIKGVGLKYCSSDIILSSVGWISVTFGYEQLVTIKAYTPYGKGICLRQPSLVPEAIQERGRRNQKGNRTAFLGKSSLRKK